MAETFTIKAYFRLASDARYALHQLRDNGCTVEEPRHVLPVDGRGWLLVIQAPTYGASSLYPSPEQTRLVNEVVQRFNGRTQQWDEVR